MNSFWVSWHLSLLNCSHVMYILHSVIRTDTLRKTCLTSVFLWPWLLWKTPELENSEPRGVSAVSRLLVLPRQNLVGTGLWLLLKCQYSKACSVKQIFGIRSLNDTDFRGLGSPSPPQTHDLVNPLHSKGNLEKILFS